ncbi:MAG: SpoIIE family protein phosphatase [Actinomycetota bacterium]|nr:SpoIIE family protein phosphatase [Actinomycetota bacterium]
MGPVACHHYAGPHRPSPTDRVTVEFLGRTASLLLGTTSETANADRVLAVAEAQSGLLAGLARAPRAPLSALVSDEHSVLDLLPAGGAAVRLDGRLHLLGLTPAPERVRELLAALPGSGTTATETVSRAVPDADDVVGTAVGVLAVPVRGAAAGDVLAWFRPETLREVHWGGDPHSQELVEDARGLRLSPRRSFARWSETVRGSSESWQPHEVAAAEQLAAHLGEVLLRRSEQESRLAATLQRTLLLEQLPDLPGLDLAVRYQPSAQDVVGGDWYDVFLLPDGRVSVVLGDVAGHGLGAAAVTAQLRHGLRAYLLRAAGPAAALQRLNELVAFLLPDELATAVVAELDPVDGRLTVASAGHVPALLLAPDGGHVVERLRGPGLGLLEDARYDELDLRLDGTDRLLLYSDGLVERRGEDVGSGVDRLRRVAAAAPRQAEALLDAVMAELPRGTDDVTVLALGRSG